MGSRSRADAQAAVAISTISSSGIVTDIYIIDGGDGYGSSPVITIDPPKSADEDVSLGGSFIFNEVVTGSQSGTSARVKEWNGNTNIMEVSIVSGIFVNGEYLTGADSGARYLIGGVDTDDLVTPYADNDNIEREADSIIDFSSSNPFGMP